MSEKQEMGNTSLFKNIFDGLDGGKDNFTNENFANYDNKPPNEYDDEYDEL